MSGAVAPSLGWFGIVRLGLVQTALGAIFVLATSTTNRVMVIELALPAVLPGALIGLHYAVQVLRPRLGWGSDRGGRRTPWIIGGMAVLALGGVGSAIATALMAGHLLVGIALAIPSFILIGLGVGAAGTTLLVLLAKRTAPARRGAAAALVWIMMIIGFVVTAAIAGRFLDPFSPQRLVGVAAAIAAGALLATVIALWGIEPSGPGPRPVASDRSSEPSFVEALRGVWREPLGRRFAIFIFVSMLAYGGEDLVIEPFAGAVAGLTPGATAKLSGMLHGGALAGMALVAVLSLLVRGRQRVLPACMVGGCVASAVALLALATCGLAARPDLFRPVLVALGASNGTYAVAAIGSMMQLVGSGPEASGGGREGTRMGIWGAAQALAFGGGGLLCTVASDVARHVAAPASAYACVFAGQAFLFTAAAILASRLNRPNPALRTRTEQLPPLLPVQGS